MFSVSVDPIVHAAIRMSRNLDSHSIPPNIHMSICSYKHLVYSTPLRNAETVAASYMVA